jgi:hypothetical protein
MAYRLSEVEVEEISFVDKPAVPRARILLTKRSKGAIPYSVHGDGPKADEDASWDGDAEVAAAATVEQL